MQEVQRPLLTPDECLRMPGPKKDAQGSPRVSLLNQATWWSIAPVSRRSMVGNPFIFRMKPSRHVLQFLRRREAIYSLLVFRCRRFRSFKGRADFQPSLRRSAPPVAIYSSYKGDVGQEDVFTVSADQMGFTRSTDSSLTRFRLEKREGEFRNVCSATSVEAQVNESTYTPTSKYAGQNRYR